MLAFRNLNGLKPETRIQPSQNYSDSDRWIAAASYFYFVSAIILLLRKNKSEFVNFHARQGLVIFILALIFWLLPSIFGFLPNILGILVNATLLALIILAAVRAYRSDRWKIPYIADIANSIDL